MTFLASMSNADLLYAVTIVAGSLALLIAPITVVTSLNAPDESEARRAEGLSWLSVVLAAGALLLAIWMRAG